VRLVTPSEYLGEHGTHQKMTPGASSWGKKDYFQTWVEEREYQPNHWIFRHLYRMCNHAIDCATRFKDLDLETETDPKKRVLARALNQMVRELFLAISSDWGFLISTGQAVRYSEVRTIKHLDRTKELIRQIESADINLGYLCTLEMADNIFNRDMDFRTLCRG
jgi:1,4-alpha-glucan branching enzyme